MTKKELIQYVSQRITNFKTLKEEKIEEANNFHRQGNYSNEEWYRARAMGISARIHELENILDLLN